MSHLMNMLNNDDGCSGIGLLFFVFGLKDMEGAISQGTIAPTFLGSGESLVGSSIDLNVFKPGCSLSGHRMALLLNRKLHN